MGIFIDKTIRIECIGSTTVTIEDLNWFQGKLKTFTDDDYEKMKKSIIELGFSDPISIWKDETGKIWTHDGHGRSLTLRKMQQEGFTIPPLPASEIIAKNKTEAKKKLLANDSRYGKVNEDGLTEFLNEEDSIIPVEEVQDYLDFPEIDFLTGETEEEPGVSLSEPKEIECPECHAKFTPKKA